MVDSYVTDKKDIVFITFNPQAGHEQAGHRPALVISPKAYNKSRISDFLSITAKIKGYPFEVLIPEGLEIKGAILVDQVKSLDWRIRQTKFICTLPHDSFNEAIEKLSVLISK
ncbi:MAG: type II toxin-antitoxin system PemK/MazF family toxin [Hydrogenobaculum sp.]